MNNGTCIAFVLFYIFRHYKRIGNTAKRKELVSDLKKCYTILKRMENNIDPHISTGLVMSLINRVNSFGANMELNLPLRYADIYDYDIIKLMSKITGEIITFARHASYKKASSEIFTRFLILHNLPRALLNNSSGDMSVTQNFHISKQKALEYVSVYLCNEGEYLSKTEKLPKT